MLSPTLFSASLARPGPKHSISAPFIAGVKMPLSVDVNEGPCVPNPAPNTAVKLSLGPQMEEDVDL